ncbi:MAG: beta-ketoacyl synthase [Pseudomonadales bacterium]|jgi:acetoacetyl-[acyl-carrier protein] synthase|nr:beta-ketoacyl synthase [Pseudomonadales bacterium]
MQRLPLIVSFGGISPAGRSAFHYAYQRLIFERLSANQQLATLRNLALLMGLVKREQGQWLDSANNPIALDAYLGARRQQILDGTLIRKLEHNLFDPAAIPMHTPLNLHGAQAGQPLEFRLATRKLPAKLPSGWKILRSEGEDTLVRVSGALDVLIRDTFPSPVNSAGQLPSGFTPEKLYPSRSHPRGLQLTLYAASDALNALGLDWELIRQKVAPDQITVHAGSSLNQLDYDGYGGLLKARLLGKKITSKQLPLGFGEMPADFINAYILGNVGATGTNLGACASFHYNLSQAVKDIQSGRCRLALVGAAEAPLTPDVIEAFANMGALADDEGLKALDGLAAPDHRRACRPFGNNIGFTLAESAQFIVLCDDALALELGANIHGAVNDVFVNADGFKKSIASPGVGNYLTMAKAAASTQAVVGEKALRERSFVQAHGTGTPQNRVTESAIFSEVARHFGIRNWPIAALKSYLGHSIASAGADQLALTLGVWRHGIIPGILTTGQIAEDVHREGLDILLDHREVGAQNIDAVLLNSKGFGGNNATASILAPHIARRMLQKRHGKAALTQWEKANEAVLEAAERYHQRSNEEPTRPLYFYDHDVRDGGDITFNENSLSLRGYGTSIDLALRNPYADMCE